jgi:thioredoxin-related protein
LACYWCNNSKSDEFSEPEFKNYIAPGIEKVWDERKKIENQF